MGDLEYIISIIARLRDEASPRIAALRAEIDKLKGTQDADKATQDLGRSVEDLGGKSDKTRKSQESLRSEHERSRRAAEDASRGAKNLADDVDRTGKVYDNASESVRGHTKSQQDFADSLAKVREESRKTDDGLKDLEIRISKVDAASKNFEERRRAGNLSSDEVKRYSQDFSKEYNNIANSMKRAYGIGSEEADKYRAKAEEAARASKESARLARGDSGAKSFDALNEALSGAGGGFRITGVASFIQGIKDLSVLIFSPQLITGIASLAGSLVSVGSAAAEAGAALTGAFVSGIGQAIPMLSIIVAAVERFKTILQAVSVAGQAEQQKFFNPTEKQVSQLQNASQLVSAQQQLSNSYIQLYEAQQRVRDSQIALNEARYEALRNITELSLAEKNARLQAEGAELSLSESRRQLQIDIQKGNVANLASAELAVKQAELSQKKAEFEIPKAEREARLARQRGVEGTPAVISAREGLEGAHLAVTQARQGAEAARRQEQITRLQQASRSSRETQYESQLKFLEKGMSSTELGLTNSLIGIEKELKSPDSPLKKITDYFVQPFTEAIEKIRSLLHTSSFLGPIDELAKSMGEGVKRLEGVVFGEKGTSFFETMAKNATENIPVISSTIEHLMNLFEDIAKAAAPAFHKLSVDWDKFWSKLDIKYSSNTGLSMLEEFFNKSIKFAEGFAHLGVSLFDLFKAIGKDAAPQGLATVNSFSQTIEKATSWVQSHGPEVTKFFKESREGLSTIGGLLLSIGKDFLEAFSLSSLKALSGFLSQFLLPGLRDVISVIGKITTAILEFFNLFGSAGHKALEALAAFVLGFLAVAKAVEMVKELKKAFIELKVVMMESPWIAIATGIAAAAAALGLFDENQKKNKVTTEEADQALERQAEALRTIKSLNDEYKSSELSVREAKTQVDSAEQSLNKTRREGPYHGESKAEYETRLQQDEQAAQRSKLNYEERQSEFSKLPERQKETRNRELLENQKDLNTVRSHYKNVSEEASKLEKTKNEVESFVKPSERGEDPYLIEIDKKLIVKQRERAESQEKLGIVTKRSNELIASSTELTSQGATKISDAYGEAFRKFESSVSKGASAAHDGMSKIRELVDKELKKYGVSPAEIAGAAHGARSALSGAAGWAGKVFSGITGHAAGAYVQARPGGQIARIAEDNHDEVVLSTDPRHAQRSRALLGQYFSRAPHMAEGGPVGYESPFHGAVRWGRSDQGTDVNLTPGSPITAIGDAKIKGIISNWYQGQPYIWYELLSGLDKGKDVYVAEQINRLARVGQEVRAGQPIAYYAPSGTGIETGWATASGQTLAQVTSGYREGQATPAGKAFTSFLQGLASGKVIAGQMGSGLQQIIAPIIKGGGDIGKVGQSALNLATKAANIYLEKHLQSSIEEQPSGSGSAAPRGQVTSWLAKALKITNHYSTANLNALYGRTIQESSGNPLSINLWDSNAKAGHPSKGLLQVIPETFASYMLKGFGDIWNPVDNAIAAIRYMYARYGHIVGPSGSGYDVGGSIGRAPWGGKAVPIIAHEGERIMNPAQYDATARMAGMSPGGLDNYLGFDGSPRQSFASGGKVSRPEVIGSYAQRTTSSPAPFNPGLEHEFENIVNEIYKFSNVLNVFKKLKKAFSKLKTVSSNKFSSDLEKIINEITIETNGVLARLQEGREFLKSKLSRGAVEKEYTQRAGRVQLGPRGEVGIAQENEKVLAEESKYLQMERKVIDESIAQAKKIKNSGKREIALKSLYIKQKELGEAIDSNIEARYQAEIQVFQDQINQLNTEYQTKSEQLSTQLNVAQSLGNLAQINPIEDAIKQAAEAQYHQLGSALISAQGTGDIELVNQIKQEMASLEQTIFGVAAEKIASAQSLIERESGQRESYSQINLSRAKISAQLGNFSEAGSFEKTGLEERGRNLLTTRAEEEQLKAQAAQEGDTAAVISLTEELNKNTVEIAENNLALKESVVATRELVINQIQAIGQFKSGVYSAASQGLETLGKITGYLNVGGLLSAAKGREGVLGGERSQLEQQAAQVGLGVEGMTPAQILSYLASPAGQQKLSQIESKEDKAEKEQLYKLVDALETNATNTLKNSEEIAKLNGQLNQPQGFSTTAWNSMRSAFFTGMGNLLPQYASALPAGALAGMPEYGLQAPGASVSTSTTNIGPFNMTHPVQRIDPNLFGQQLTHIMETTPSMQQ